jgi:microcystin-dependent protein
MHRIDTSTATNDNKFTHGNPSTATPATVISADWLNAVQEEIVTVITGAGISLSKPTNTQLLEAIRALGTPVGAVEAYAGAAAPTGWLLCNGQAVSRTTFASLFAIVGTTFGAGNGSSTFNVPDLRGEFIRGLDGGRSIDTGRTLGSAQKGTIMPLDSTGDNQPYVPAFTSSPGPAVADTALVAARTGLDVGNASDYPNTQTIYVNGGGSGGFFHGVVRPRNVALNYIIKT